ncbi:MAG: glycosyltransferase [Candidatus Omnitrophica bacterium]|nr:glycosyltransferase [Candidatus Omnitrophota bacterium]
MPKKALLLYISEVSGHHQATLAIESALKRLDQNIEVLNLNAFNYTTPISEKIINQLYIKVIKRTPKIWKYLYDNPSVIENTRQIKKTIHKLNSPKLKILIDRFKPTCIVCTQAYPCGMIADCKRTFGLNIPLIGVLTDYAPHSFWIYDEVDYYIVPAEEVKQAFVQKGVEAKKVINFGIPIDPKFVQSKNKELIAHKLGLNPSGPIIMIMGGSQGIGPIKKIVNDLEAFPFELQILVICGVNKTLLKWLKRKSKKGKKKLIALEYVETIDELMEIASLIITKPGGLTTAEALAKGLPLLIVNPIPGQEVANANFLTKKGAGITIEKMKDFSKSATELLIDQKRLNDMSFQARQISKPKAAIDIASLIIKLCSNTSFTD